MTCIIDEVPRRRKRISHARSMRSVRKQCITRHGLNDHRQGPRPECPSQASACLNLAISGVVEHKPFFSSSSQGWLVSWPLLPTQALITLSSPSTSSPEMPEQPEQLEQPLSSAHHSYMPKGLRVRTGLKSGHLPRYDSSADESSSPEGPVIYSLENSANSCRVATCADS
jgi:hypothetical protein